MKIIVKAKCVVLDVDCCKCVCYVSVVNLSASHKQLGCGHQDNVARGRRVAQTSAHQAGAAPGPGPAGGTAAGGLPGDAGNRGAKMGPQVEEKNVMSE